MRSEVDKSDSKPPLFKFQLQLRGRLGGGCLNILPFLLRVLEEQAVVHIAHEQYPDHTGQAGEAPFPLERPLYQRQQQIRYECYPDLYLDGVGTLPVEVV